MSTENNPLEQKSQESLVGQEIAGYKIIQRIDDRFVYLGVKDDESVAIKVFYPDPYACNRDEILSRLNSICSLEHENIVKVYSMGETENFIYAVMEYVPGENLYNLMQRNPRLHWAAAAELARDIVAGLLAAHSQGITHRCLHPDRVLLGKTGQVKITFCNEGEISFSKEAANFVAPEFFLGQDIDQKSDIYSLGTIIYTIVTGKAPLAGKTPKEIAIKHREMLPVLPVYGVADIPHILSLILERSLEKDPKERYHNTLELRAAINNFLLNDIGSYKLGSYKDLFKVVEDTVGLKITKKRTPESLSQKSKESSSDTTHEGNQKEDNLGKCLQHEWQKFKSTVFPISPYFLKFFLFGFASLFVNALMLVLIKILF